LRGRGNKGAFAGIRPSFTEERRVTMFPVPNIDLRGYEEIFTVEREKKRGSEGRPSRLKERKNRHS